MADIKESRIQKASQLISEFKNLVESVNKRFRNDLLSPLTITLGDEFQSVLTNAEASINVIFDLEEQIIKKGYGFKLRYVLQSGKIDTKINSKIAYEMLGEGLTIARARLEAGKKERSRFSIELKTEENLNIQLNNAFFIYQHFIDRWKEDDFELVKGFLNHEDYKQVASKLKMDNSSVWRREKSLNMKEYRMIKELIQFLVIK